MKGRTKSVTLAALVAALLLCFSRPVFAYVLIGAKQQFYSPGVVAFKWGTLTDTETIWRQAFLAASYSWTNAQNEVQWGEVSSGTNNIMQVYYDNTDPAPGHCQMLTSGGIITRAWMELNQYWCASQSHTWRRSVACHEQGHGFGLGDNNSGGMVIMNQLRDKLVVYSPATDDINGVTAIY